MSLIHFFFLGALQECHVSLCASLTTVAKHVVTEVETSKALILKDAYGQGGVYLD